MTIRRIVSFLPSATEMAFALGLGEQVVGVSHECDFPPEAARRPAVVRPAVDMSRMTLEEIDRSVSARLKDGQSLYTVDENLLRELQPDLLLTQNLCQVCAPSGNEVSQVVAALPKTPEILWLTPKSIDQIFQNIRDIAAATGRTDAADALIVAARRRLEAVAARTKDRPRPRVFCMEWLDPVYCSGHWVPEMVELAGGVDALGRRGTDSVRISWDDVLRWDPEVLILCPCGFRLEAAVAQADELKRRPGWSEISAVRNGRVFAVDANSYFARPGPRVVDGTELLAHLLHPEAVGWNGPVAFERLSLNSPATLSQFPV